MRRGLPQVQVREQVRVLVMVMARQQSSQQREVLRERPQQVRIRLTCHRHPIQQSVYPRAYHLESL